MTPDEIKANLTEEEFSLHSSIKIPPHENAPGTDELLKSLAACRKLSEERRVMLEKIYSLSHYTYAGQKEFKPSIPLTPDLKNSIAALLAEGKE